MAATFDADIALDVARNVADRSRQEYVTAGAEERCRRQSDNKESDVVHADVHIGDGFESS